MSSSASASPEKHGQRHRRATDDNVASEDEDMDDGTDFNRHTKKRKLKTQSGNQWAAAVRVAREAKATAAARVAAAGTAAEAVASRAQKEATAVLEPRRPVALSEGERVEVLLSGAERRGPGGSDGGDWVAATIKGRAPRKSKVDGIKASGCVCGWGGYTALALLTHNTSAPRRNATLQHAWL